MCKGTEGNTSQTIKGTINSQVQQRHGAVVLLRESGTGVMHGWLGNLAFTLRAGGATDDFKAGSG